MVRVRAKVKIRVQSGGCTRIGGRVVGSAVSTTGSKRVSFEYLTLSNTVILTVYDVAVVVERPRKCALCSLTVAKHGGPYANYHNDRQWSPQTTGHVCLHILIGFARTMCSPTND